MAQMFDLRPTARRIAKLLAEVADGQLSAPTPCTEYRLGDLIDHVDGLSLAFAAAAAKDLGPRTSQAPSPDAARLAEDWRTEVVEHVLMLAEAWQDPPAWEGMTQAGGVDLPAEVAGQVALNELVLHGWDIARASGQRFEPDPEALSVSWEFVALMSTPEEQAGREGLFGPVIDVPADAPLLDRVAGMSGRDPGWTAT